MGGVGELPGRAVGLGEAGVAEARLARAVAGRAVKVRAACPAVAAGAPAVLIPGAVQAAEDNSRMESKAKIIVLRRSSGKDSKQD